MAESTESPRKRIYDLRQAVWETQAQATKRDRPAIVAGQTAASHVPVWRAGTAMS